MDSIIYGTIYRITFQGIILESQSLSTLLEQFIAAFHEILGSAISTLDAIATTCAPNFTQLAQDINKLLPKLLQPKLHKTTQETPLFWRKNRATFYPIRATQVINYNKNNRYNNYRYNKGK